MADDDFLDDFKTGASSIIREYFFGLLVGRWLANDDVGTGTKRVLLAAPFQDKVVRWSPGRHDVLTYLTAEHGNEPMD